MANEGIYVGFANNKEGCDWNEDTSRISSFNDLGLEPPLLKNLDDMILSGTRSSKKPVHNDHAHPLPVQRYALKPAIANEDIYCISSTGK